MAVRGRAFAKCRNHAGATCAGGRSAQLGQKWFRIAWGRGGRTSDSRKYQKRSGLFDGIHPARGGGSIVPFKILGRFVLQESHPL